MNKAMALQIAAFIQNISETVNSDISRCCSRRRNMYLLTNGHWIDTTTTVPTNMIDMTYDSEKHAIVADSPPGPTTRWPWLSVITTEEEDISDFFSSLRISTGCCIPATTVMMLYAHQKGVLYSRGLIILKRDGTFVDYP